MTPTERMALAYVQNTAGAGTKAHFLEDHEPVGEALWNVLHGAGLIEEKDGRVRLTAAGAAKLDGRE